MATKKGKKPSIHTHSIGHLAEITRKIEKQHGHNFDLDNLWKRVIAANDQPISGETTEKSITIAVLDCIPDEIVKDVGLCKEFAEWWISKVIPAFAQDVINSTEKTRMFASNIFRSTVITLRKL